MRLVPPTARRVPMRTNRFTNERARRALIALRT
jgi:hypothetical protein